MACFDRLPSFKKGTTHLLAGSGGTRAVEERRKFSPDDIDLAKDERDGLDREKSRVVFLRERALDGCGNGKGGEGWESNRVDRSKKVVRACDKSATIFFPPPRWGDFSAFLPPPNTGGVFSCENTIVFHERT